MRATVRCPGTCGELVQGTLDGANFLITCPVDRYSQVTIELVRGTDRIRGFDGRPKTGAAVRRVLDELGLPEYGAEAVVTSTLPKGKGMASSTADIAAACLAAALAAGRVLTPARIADLALAVEPSDGTMYPGIWMFDHVTGRTRRWLGNAPPLTIIALDTGGIVDTLAFNARTDLADKNRAKEGEIRTAVEMVCQGIAKGDACLVACGATISARANQAILYKPELEEVLAYSAELGAYGVNVAHSGTLIGVLFPRSDDCRRKADMLSRRFPGLENVFLMELINGGLEVIEPENRQGGIWVCR